jgi:glucose/arabinose dehydrogenase
MKHEQILSFNLAVISVFILVFGVSLTNLQWEDSTVLLLSSPRSPFVFAQPSDEPVLRFSDEIGNPVFNQPGFTAEVVAEGLTLPTTIAFLSPNDIFVLEKDKGTVMRVINGEVQSQPLLDVNVATEVERCMCGIAISQNNETGKTNVFLYYTEAEGQDGGTPIANRLYRYELVSGGGGEEEINDNSSNSNSTVLPIRLILHRPLVLQLF